MHMADALLSGGVALTMAAVSAAAVAYSATKIERSETAAERTVPLMGVMGAFVFAAQMINFTIPLTGSSGHIGGGILLAAVLGAYPALITITSVLVVQSLFFADGGLMALGCNIFNMGVIPCLIVYPLLYKPLIRGEITPKKLAVASIVSVVVGLQLGALGVVLETTASRVTELPFGAFLLLMQPIHLAIGLGEGIATALVLTFIFRMRPEILTPGALGGIAFPKAAAALLTAALIIGGVLSLTASEYPDGLEWSIEKIAGAAELERGGVIHEKFAGARERTAIMPDYSLGEESKAGTAGAGLAGGLLTLVIAGGVGFAVYRWKARQTVTRS